MKKLSLLIALCMLISIGGVYATWNYAGKAMDNAHEHLTLKLAASQSDNVAEGQFIRVGTAAITLWLDDANNDHVAEVVCDGKMQFVFLPGKGAADDIKDGIVMQYQVENRNSLAYKNNEIFSVNHAAPTVISGNVTPITTGTEIAGIDLTAYKGGFYFEITAAMVQDKISADLELATLAEYNEFKEFFEAAAKGNILGVTISKKSND